MRGVVHAAIGVSTPIGLVATQHVTLLQGGIMAVISAGYSLLPDVDTPSSYASKALGGFFHRFVHKLCKAMFHATATSRDERWVAREKIHRRDPYHRSLTHTLVVALGMAAIAYLASWMSTIAAGFVAAFGVFLLWPLPRIKTGFVVFGALAASVGASLVLTPWHLALAVGGGYISSVVADACTKRGVPALWPLKIQGKRWWNIRLLGSMILSGSPQEKGPAIGVSLATNALLVFMQF